jgi:hypothetical protein
MFERVYFEDEERERRRLDNALILEEVRDAQLNNIAKAIDIANRIPDQEIRDTVMQEIRFRIRGIHPGVTEGERTVEFNRLQLTKGEVRG